MELDLSSNASVDQYLAAISQEVDVLVNNAGINPLGGATEFNDLDLQSVLQVNLAAPMRLIRALSPAPGAWTEAKGERLKILYAEPAECSGAPGEVLDDRLTVACGSGALRLVRLQRAGRGVMSAAELLRGFSLTNGTRFV